jgi:hypothetical protein
MVGDIVEEKIPIAAFARRRPPVFLEPFRLAIHPPNLLNLLLPKVD